jgi:hypothetical protein
VFELTVAPTLLGLPQAEGIGVLVLVGGLVALAVALLLRRRRRPAPTGTSRAPEGPGAQG